MCAHIGNRVLKASDYKEKMFGRWIRILAEWYQQVRLFLSRYVGSSGALLLCIFLLAGMGTQSAQAQERLSVKAFDNPRYGRLIFDFSERLDLPVYAIQNDNGILSVEFEEDFSVVVPDIATILSRFVTVARVDPGGRGVRLGLQEQFNINTIQAGEKLFLDILDNEWEGEFPGLPDEVIAELAKRSKARALQEERERKAEIIRVHNPTVDLSVGRHPTFIRLQFDWSMDVEAEYRAQAQQTTLKFSLPLQVDLFDLKAELPAEILSADNLVDLDGSMIVLNVAEGVLPRYYKQSSSQYIIDIDLPNGVQDSVDLADLLPENAEKVEDSGEKGLPINAFPPNGPQSKNTQVSLTPVVETSGENVRIVFPFESDTSAAVFRRGDTLWMLYDTSTSIVDPGNETGLDVVADGFDSKTSGDLQIVRMDLVTNRLASLASEGRSWVLSLGNILLAPAQPAKFERGQDANGAFFVTADVSNVSKIHQVRDPIVGDVLQVATAFPPSNSVSRTLEFVDFTALRSVHGLVIKPAHEDLVVQLNRSRIIMSAPKGLIVSPAQVARASDAQDEMNVREGFIDLAAFEEINPKSYLQRLSETMQMSSTDDARELEAARLTLAQYYLANQLSYEALGVLRVLSDDASREDLKSERRLTNAAALISAGRSEEAIPILNRDEMTVSVDALMWRVIAREAQSDFIGARTDTLVVGDVYESYPMWVQNKYLLASIHAALETDDTKLAVRYLGLVDPANLSPEDRSLLVFYSAWLNELEDRLDEALDTYGQVITADLRPTRAKAIHRTLLLLDKMGRLDPVKAAETLATESMVWRGDDLEVEMLRFSMELFARAQDYRSVFELVRLAASSHPQNTITDQMLVQASDVFSDLFLNGTADVLGPVEALTLYYDYRQFTPAGARGDEMIRNLARRLIRVDLLEQASNLLEYQIDNRLKGAARAQIAADLAVIYVANRQPDLALRALSKSRIAGLPNALERQRRILESRALVDAGRENLALDLLTSLDGRDADLLRVDAHWRAKRYRDAGELLERLYAPQNSSEGLSPVARQNMIRAAVGFVLADDQFGLSRLRSKFAEQMASSPEWPVFNFVTGPIEVTSVEFRKVAQQVADVDSLNAFLRSYRQVYEADGALAPTKSVEDANA